MNPNQTQQPAAATSQETQRQQITPPTLVIRSKLLNITDFDASDDLDKQWSTCHKQAEELVDQLSEAEAQNKLVETASESTTKHTELTTGFLFGILTVPEFPKAQQYVKYCTMFVRDGYATVIQQLQRLIHEKYPKLLDLPRERLLWLTEEVVKLNAQESDTICTLLLRFVTGDIGPKNLWLLTALLQLFTRNTQWLHNNNKLFCTAVYTYIRLLPDHQLSAKTNPQVQVLLPNEVQFCVTSIREHLVDLVSIGRDFIRVIHDAKGRIPEMNEIWNDLQNNPSKFDESGQTFTNVSQILEVPTRPRYLQSRITPDMEKQLVFIMMQVKMGGQRRYQQWFSQRHFATPESETLIIDIIRWICASFHPSNQILAGGFVPRWAMIGWLLKSTVIQHILERAKVALIYDWLFFNPKADSVMNVEPAMLLMIHSIPKYMDITAGVLESILAFIKADSNQQEPSKFIISKENMTVNIQQAFQVLLEKGVIRTLTALSECPQLETQLKERLKRHFPTLTVPPPTPAPTPATQTAPQQPAPVPAAKQQPQQQSTPFQAPQQTATAPQPSPTKPPKVVPPPIKPVSPVRLLDFQDCLRRNLAWHSSTVEPM